MKKYSFIFIIISLFTLFSACSEDGTDELFSEYASAQALLSDITISMAEQLEGVDSLQIEEEGIYLYIETTKTYPYCNYGILRSTFQKGDTLLVRLEDIVKPSINLSPKGPAMTNVRIPENTKQIVFLRGYDSDRFELIVEEDALILQPLQTSFVGSDHIIFLRPSESTQ